MDPYTAGFLAGIIMGVLGGAIGVLFIGALKDDRKAKKFN